MGEGEEKRIGLKHERGRPPLAHDTNAKIGGMTVTITFAMDWEFAPWRRLRAFQRSADGPAPTYTTQVGHVNLRIALTGVGHHAASVAAERVFQPRPDVFITSGTAGGLRAELGVADVIMAASVRGTNGHPIESDPRLRALALDCGARPVGTLYSSPAIVGRAEQKRSMSRDADAVDMESAVMLAESTRRGIPGIAIRVISDAAGVDMPIDLNSALTAAGGFSALRLLSALARRPHAVPALVRLGLDGHRAAGVLASFLDTYVEQIGALAR
jgi:nucleoside phosphorylase